MPGKEKRRRRKGKGRGQGRRRDGEGEEERREKVGCRLRGMRKIRENGNKWPLDGARILGPE